MGVNLTVGKEKRNEMKKKKVDLYNSTLIIGKVPYLPL